MKFYSHKINEDYILCNTTLRFMVLTIINESITHKLLTISMTMYSLNFKALL